MFVDSSTRAAWQHWLLAAVFIFLTACGGGGGGGDPAPAAPAITQQPASTSVQPGAAASFSVAAQGSAPLMFQWLRNGAEVAGATSSTYTLSAATLADNGSSWSVRVTNAGGSVTSGAAVLTVSATPGSPTGISAFLGDTYSAASVDGLRGQASFNHISDISVDAEGGIYISESGFPVAGVRVLGAPGSRGAVTTLPITGNSCAAQQTSVAAAGDGSLYVPLNVSGVSLGLCRRSASGEWSMAVPASSLRGYMRLARTRGNGIFLADGTRVFHYNPVTGLRLVAGIENTTTTPFVARDGIGTEARFSDISDITADASGTAYVVDRGYGIRKVTEDSIVTTVAAWPAAGTFEKVAVDAQGNLAVLEWNTDHFPSGPGLRRITPAGANVALAGGDQITRELRPVAMEYGPAGVLYYATEWGVSGLSADGAFSFLAGHLTPGGPAPDSSIPLGVDGEGSLVVGLAKNWSHDPVEPFVLRRFNAAGQQLPYGASGVVTFPERPNGSGMDLAGNLYLAYARYQNPVGPVARGLATTSEIYKVTPEGSVSRLYNKARGDADFVSPVVIAVDGQGTLYMGDAASNTIRKLQADGSTVLVAQGDFNADRPSTLAVTPAGTLYLGLNGGAIARVNADGSFTTIAGVRDAPAPIVAVDGAGSAARFRSRVLNLAPDASGNLYVGDYDTVRKVTPDGVVTTVAGTLNAFVPAAQPGPLPGVPGFVSPFWGGSFGNPYRDPYLERIVGRGNTVYYQNVDTAVIRARLP